MMRWLILVPLLALAPRTTPSLAGDWDVYIALSAQPKFGFEGWRRMGYAHFAGSDSGNVGWLRRRTGEPMLTVTRVSVQGDSVLLTQDARVTMRAAWHGDTLAGLQYNGDRPLDRRSLNARARGHFLQRGDEGTVRRSDNFHVRVRLFLRPFSREGLSGAAWEDR